MRKNKYILVIITAFMFIFLCACGDNAEKPDTRTFEAGILTITFDYEKISGYASNQFAVWVEKSDIASMPDYYVDAVAGATPKASGSQSCAWNLKDEV